MENIFQNGSKWLRADFHLHTRADKKEFTYLGDDNSFVNDYVNQLVAQDIQIGVIANHNKFDPGEFKAIKKRARKENIFILPGVELSVNDGANGIHCLLVFDFEKWYTNGDDFINQFLTAAFEGIENHENENTRCQYNLETVLQKLNGHANKGRDSFIVLAHVEQSSGFFHMPNGGHIQQLASNKLFRQFVLGFQKVRSFDKVNDWKSWLKGYIPAFVEGSDPKCLEETGRPQLQKDKEKRTFVKVGDFNFEALKYALTDFEHRIKDYKPALNNAYIKSITFEYGRSDVETIDFSPELNSLIGIRGSGKSSIIEILRYTLGVPLSPVAVDKNYKDGLIENVLKSGGKSVVTVVNKNGEEYRIKKIYGQKEDIFQADVPKPGISIEAIFDMPVYFGQKDLSHKDTNFEADFIRRLTGTRLKDIHSKIEHKKSEVEIAITEIKKYKNLSELKRDTETAMQNARHQLEFFREKGVEEKLKQQTLFDSDVSKMSHTDESLKSYLKELESVISNNNYFFQQEMTGSAMNNDFFEEAQALIQALKTEFEKLKTAYGNSIQLQQRYKELMDSMTVKREGLKEEFAKIKREINEETVNPDNFLKLNRQIEISKLKLLEIDRLEKKRKEWQDDLSTKLTELENLWVEEHQLLEKEVNRIKQTTNKLDISVEFKGEREKFIDKMRQVFRGSGIRDKDYQEIEKNYKDFIQIHNDSSKLNDILNENHLVDFKRRFWENLAELLTFKVNSRIIIQYNGKSLDKHSLGQRASALILFLLAQKDNDILIIDQPEDDLDNQTIYDEVIKELKKLKGNMQFIFATHNANIPVLGDSEKVVSCSYDEKKITVHSGTIDDHGTQQTIVDIMEGGKEAFSRREDIYRIWNIEKENKK